MEELKSIKALGGQQTPDEIMAQYFQGKLLEDLLKPSAFDFPRNTNIRNEAYYAAQADPNPDSHCPCCGHAVEDPDY